MKDSNALYHSLVGPEQGANRLHIHVTELLRPDLGWGAQHSHRAEEALYMLEGEGEFTFGGKTHRVGPGQTVFFPSGVTHAETRFLSQKVKYLVIRTVEPGDEPCCCVAPIVGTATVSAQ
jgi:mannose-6-phosphate isomerase-like protein (cupin superfamily)